MVAPNTGGFASGNFAPPLDKERVALYREVAQQADKDVREEMLALCDMVDEFLDTEDADVDYETASAKGTKHPSGRGNIVRLKATTVDALEDLVPKKHHIEALKNFFDTIDSARSHSNSEKLIAWRNQLQDHFIAKHFPGKSKSDLHEMQQIAHMVRSKKGSELAIKSKNLIATAEEFDTKMQAVLDDVNEARRWDSDPPIKRPTLENTDVRAAAHHLLWYAVELSKGRVPLTKAVVGALDVEDYPDEAPITVRPIARAKAAPAKKPMAKKK